MPVCHQATGYRPKSLNAPSGVPLLVRRKLEGLRRLGGPCLAILPTVLLGLWPGEGVVPLIAGARPIIGSFRPESR
jgi:hypothetical protein